LKDPIGIVGGPLPIKIPTRIFDSVEFISSGVRRTTSHPRLLVSAKSSRTLPSPSLSSHPTPPHRPSSAAGSPLVLPRPPFTLPGEGLPVNRRPFPPSLYSSFLLDLERQQPPDADPWRRPAVAPPVPAPDPRAGRPQSSLPVGCALYGGGAVFPTWERNRGPEAPSQPDLPPLAARSVSPLRRNLPRPTGE
jgi:hypothetical protein